MRQLTSVDSQFIALEDGRNHAHVSSLAIYDPSTAPGGELTLEMLTELIEGRLHQLPPFRWRLAEVPFGIDYPYWVDHADPDLAFHIRELALPAPGDERMLCRQVARLVSRPLDRSRPLWELYLIHGLENGRVAVLTKFHHAAVDGASGAEILGILLDLEPEVKHSPQPVPPGEEVPSQLSMLGRGLSGVPRQPLRALKGMRRALPYVDQNPMLRHIPGVGTIAGASRRALRKRTSDGGVLEGRNLHAPRTFINGEITPHRRLALTRHSLDEIKAIKNHFGCTVNDVVVAICAGALRRWMDGLDELPPEPLVAMIPVSVRTPGEAGTFGNRVSTMLVSIPTDLGEPAERLARASETMTSAKAEHEALPVTVLQDANHVIPPALLARAARVTTTVAARHPSEAPVNIVISNVPGPPVPMYMAGARMEEIYPVSAIMDGVGLNLTVFSYDGSINFGVVADRGLVDDPWPLADALREAQAELVALLPTTDAAPNGSAPRRRRHHLTRTRHDQPKGRPMPEFELDITKTNIAVERAIEETENPRHRFLLEAYNRHRYLEMAGRWEEIFAPEMTVAEPLYRFNYLGKVFDLHGAEQVQAVYREWAATDQCIFYTEDEQVAVGDNMVCSRTIGYQQVTGASLVAEGVDANPDAMYLAKSLEAMIWPYDDEGRLVGEEVWEFDPSAREFIELAPEDVLTVAQSAELLEPLIRPLPVFAEVVPA